LLQRTVIFRPATGLGQSETPNHVSAGGSFRRKQPWWLAGPPMTLGNMRADGVRSLAVSCWQCHHEAVLSVDRWHDAMPVPSFRPRMVHSLRNHRCRRPAELAGTAAAGDAGTLCGAATNYAAQNRIGKRGCHWLAEGEQYRFRQGGLEVRQAITLTRPVDVASSKGIGNRVLLSS
jgi:hypothetical protein